MYLVWRRSPAFYVNIRFSDAIRGGSRLCGVLLSGVTARFLSLDLLITSELPYAAQGAKPTPMCALAARMVSTRQFPYRSPFRPSLSRSFYQFAPRLQLLTWRSPYKHIED